MFISNDFVFKISLLFIVFKNSILIRISTAFRMKPAELVDVEKVDL